MIKPKAIKHTYFTNKDLAVDFPEGGKQSCKIGRGPYIDCIEGKLFLPVGESDYKEATVAEYEAYMEGKNE